MFKLIQENKIKDIREENTFNMAFMQGEVIEDSKHTVDDYTPYGDEYLLKSEIPAPSKEEQAEKRKQAYVLEKDPITCHIQALKDEEQTPEILEEIESLKQERAEVVKEIKERFPYPEED